MSLALMLSVLMPIESVTAVPQPGRSAHSAGNTASQGDSVASNSTGHSPGFPGGDEVVGLGNSMVQEVESSAQFQELSGGLTYHVEQGRSFGYTWGVNIAPTERILFFSPNGSGEIEADVYVANGTIQQLSFANVTLANYGRF